LNETCGVRCNVEKIDCVDDLDAVGYEALRRATTPAGWAEVQLTDPRLDSIDGPHRFCLTILCPAADARGRRAAPTDATLA